MFLVNLPLGVFAALAARMGTRWRTAAGRRRAFDVRGAVLLAFVLGLWCLGLIKGPDGQPADQVIATWRSRWLGL